MDHTNQDQRGEHKDGRWKWALAGFLAVAGFFLWTEHRAHLLGFLPYLLILACPLMHLFHHGGHGGGTRVHGGPAEENEKEHQHPRPGG